jgi:hypothetical protein
MKKRLLCIILLVTFTGTLFAQPFGRAAADYRITRMLYTNSSGERGYTLFRYDRDDRLTRSLWSLEDSSRYSLNFYEYDLNGQMVAAFREFSDGLTSFERFEYDIKGNKIAEYFVRSDSVSGTAVYHYDEERLLQADFHRYKGWLNGTLVYRYNAANNPESAVLVRNGNKICEVQYAYDAKGNLVRENWDFAGQWHQEFQYEYEKEIPQKVYYSSPFLAIPFTHRISREHYTFNNEVAGPSMYYYNDRGQLTKKVFIRSDSVSTHTYYEYDPEGRLKASVRHYADNETARFSYKYDESNRLIMRYYYRADTVYGFESYLYNADGALVKAYLKNFDNWLTGLISFRTDHLGRITGGVFKGENGFDAVLQFSYNKQGLLSDIHWNFSFGKFQKYSFYYLPVDSL